MNPTSLFCLVLLGAEFLWFSRLLWLVHDPISSLGAIPPVAALLISAVDGYKAVPIKVTALLYSFIFLTALWMYVFYTNSGLIGDLRAFANISGLLCFFYFLYCFRHLGSEKTLNILYYFAMVYVILYVLASVIAPSIFSSEATLGVLLQDPIRGTRVFAASALIAFALFRLVFEVSRLRNLAVNLPCLGMVILAIFYQQSRVSTTLYVIVSLLVVFAKRPQRMFAINAIILLFVLYAGIAMVAAPAIAEFIDSFNDVTLSLRLQTFGIAYQNFVDNPLLGLGLPSEPAYYRKLFGPLYFPEDLGALGLLGSYGLAGFGWTLALALMLKSAVRRIDRVDSANFSAVAHVAIFGMMTLFFSQNIFQNDGGVMSSAALALQAHLIRLDVAARRRLLVLQNEEADPGGGAPAGAKA